MRLYLQPDSYEQDQPRRKTRFVLQPLEPKDYRWLNGQQVKPVKSLGEFPWHHHEHEDELFYVVKGWLRMEFRDRSVVLREGEMIVVPRGVEHRPVAEEEVCVLLFAPAGTLNTVASPEWI